MAGGEDERDNPQRRPQRPRVGGVYKWHPIGLDQFDPKITRPKGSLVRVAKGSKAGIRGRMQRPFTYLEDPSTCEFLVLALDDSLREQSYTEDTTE